MAKNEQQVQRAGFFFRLGIIFLLTWIILQIFFPAPDQSQEAQQGAVKVAGVKEDYVLGQLVEVQLTNTTTQEQRVNLSIAKEDGKEWTEKTPETFHFDAARGIFDFGDHTGLCTTDGTTLILAPETTCVYSSSEENHELFETGNYLVEIEGSEELSASVKIPVEEPGFFRSLFRVLLFKPFENTLLFFTSISGYHLWAGVILLTLLVKLLLIAPSRKGIIAQQKMQKLQPELDKLKKKYANDQQKQAQEMLGLFKKHKVSPFSAIMPMLVQLPVLIALFFVVKDGLLPHNEYLLYPVAFLQSVDFTAINFQFLWMDLSAIDPVKTLPLAVAVGLLQFWQMQSMAKRNKQKNGESKHANILKIMNYVLPVIVVVFSITLPPAVALYWGISTLFAIAQQYVLQREQKNA